MLAGLTSSPGWKRWLGLRTWIDDELVVADWIMGDGEPEHAVEHEAAASRAAAAEAKDELVEIVAEMGLVHRTLVGAE
jgi:hypothetical protein